MFCHILFYGYAFCVFSLYCCIEIIFYNLLYYDLCRIEQCNELIMKFRIIKQTEQTILFKIYKT